MPAHSVKSIVFHHAGAELSRNWLYQMAGVDTFTLREQDFPMEDAVKLFKGQPFYFLTNLDAEIQAEADILVLDKIRKVGCRAQYIIYNRDDEELHHWAIQQCEEVRSWGYSPHSDIQISRKQFSQGKCKLVLRIKQQNVDIEAPVTNEEELESFLFSVLVASVMNQDTFALDRWVKRMLDSEDTIENSQAGLNAYVEINYAALIHNLSYFRSRLNDNVQIMAMVKANSYGAGLDAAIYLGKLGVERFGVAYIQEGIQLREMGCDKPVMVMNCGVDHFDLIRRYDLEAEIYSIHQLKNLAASNEEIKVHIKLETGMNRLGLTEQELPELVEILNENTQIEPIGILSHLSASDNPTHDDYTRTQAARLMSMAGNLKVQLGNKPFIHLLNSSGVIRHNLYQFDAVRMGLGLYGESLIKSENQKLLPVHSLFATVSQVKEVKPPESISYNRSGRVTNHTTIATLNLGYADGLMRANSQEVGKVYIHGTEVPIIGNVCMDMCMINVTGMDVSEGDQVEIFGKNLRVTEHAERINTISYEVLTSISNRVQRIRCFR